MSEYRVWWIPQVPGNAFKFDVPDKDTGLLFLNVLAQYDLFQFDNRIKPDFCNAGGLEWRHPELTQGEWEDLDEDDATWEDA